MKRLLKTLTLFIAPILALTLLAVAFATTTAPELPTFDLTAFADSATALGAFLVGATAFARHFWLPTLDGIQVPIFVAILGLVIGALIGLSPVTTEVVGIIPGLVHGGQAALIAILGHAGIKSAIGGNNSAQAPENDTRTTAARTKR